MADITDEMTIDLVRHALQPLAKRTAIQIHHIASARTNYIIKHKTAVESFSLTDTIRSGTQNGQFLEPSPKKVRQLIDFLSSLYGVMTTPFDSQGDTGIVPLDLLQEFMNNSPLKLSDSG